MVRGSLVKINENGDLFVIPHNYDSCYFYKDACHENVSKSLRKSQEKEKKKKKKKKECYQNSKSID